MPDINSYLPAREGYLPQLSRLIYTYSLMTYFFQGRSGKLFYLKLIQQFVLIQYLNHIHTRTYHSRLWGIMLNLNSGFLTQTQPHYSQ